MHVTNKLAFVVTPSTEGMSFNERRAGISQMLDDLAKLATDDGCIAAAWALEVIETVVSDELEEAALRRSPERKIPLSQMEIHDMQFTELEIERQRHANEVHDLNRVNEELLQQVEFFEIKLRDQFAMAAMGLLDADLIDAKGLAEVSYRIADAMIAEREKGLSAKPS